MFLAIGGEAFSDDETRIVNRFRHAQNAKPALGEVAQGIEIEHLPIGEKKGVLGVIAGGRGTDDHAGGVCSAGGNAVGAARGTAECSEIGHAEDGIGLHAGETDEESEDGSEGDSALCFHGMDWFDPTYPDYADPVSGSFGVRSGCDSVNGWTTFRP